nr:DUF4468 domain-containing protein [uncultured Rhodoferax sp.]
MKFFKFVAIAAVSALTACATVDRSAPPLEIVTVHDVPGRTKQEICGAARDWAAVSFRDSNAVVQVYDPERGTMIGKGNMNLVGYGGSSNVVNFTITVDCKDGKARSKWDNFSLRFQGSDYPLLEDSLNNLQTKARTTVGSMDASLLAKLKGGAAKSDF